MAVAPVNKVREVVEYAITEIPVQKIQMGIPNYAYDWTLPFVQGTSRAAGIGNEQAVRIAAQYNAAIQFDTLAQTPFFTYWDYDGREHIVWFEDARSIRAKLGLIQEFTLAGAGYWNIMRPFTQNWLLLSQTFFITKLL